MHGNWESWQGRTWKDTVYGMISVTRPGKKDEDEEVVGTWYLKQMRLAEGIDKGKFEEVYEGAVPKDSKSIKMPHNTETIPHLFIDISRVPTKRTMQRTVACCAYNATSEFCQHLLGFKLDRHDRTWYERSSLVTRDGLPQANSFTVIQQLVEPYGAGISQIIVPRNSRRFDEYRPFMLALGCNPFFMVDGHTSNEEALVRLKIPDAAREATLSQWRFECGNQPYAGAIVMRQFEHRSIGHNGGSNYYGPRSPSMEVDEWRMAIKLDRLENIKYVRPMDIPEYEEFGGDITFDWGGIKDDNGKTLNSLSYGQGRNLPVRYTGKSSSGQSLGGRVNPPPFPGHTAKGRATGDDERVWAFPPLCEKCNKDPGVLTEVDDKRACQWCGVEIKASKVPLYDLLDGWTPVDIEDYAMYENDDGTDEAGNPFDPLYWTRHL